MNYGILTFHRAINYGGLLQSYALQMALRKMGVASDIIDYRCPFIEQMYRKRRGVTPMNIKRTLSVLFKNGVFRHNTEGFDAFVARHLNTTLSIESMEGLHRLNGRYDGFITGSDQVWSYYCADFDPAYFLHFVSDPSQKNAYAASFGVSEIPGRYHSEYQKRLSDFGCVSVRERSGEGLFSGFTGNRCERVVDPTLLLDAADWKRIMVPAPRPKRYVLLYMIAESRRLLTFAKAFAHTAGLPVLYIHDRLYKTRGMENRSRVPPEEWLTLFQNASFVFTNSYHGIAFSINFRRNFVVQYLEDNTGVNARIRDILDLFSLRDRVIYGGEVTDISTSRYDAIEERLADERKKGYRFLARLVRAPFSEI